MRNLLLRLFIITAALGVATWTLPGVLIDSLPALLVGGVVLSLVNAWVRPVLRFFAFPITLLTLGLFIFVVNGMAFGLAAWLVPGFSVGGFFWAIAGSAVVSVISFFLSHLLDSPRGETPQGHHKRPSHG